MPTSQSSQAAEQVASNLAFGLGEAGPFVAAGLSLFFGLFGSGASGPPLAQQIRNMINDAIDELEHFHQSDEIAAAASDAQAFLSQMKTYLSDGDNTVPTVCARVDGLAQAYGYEVMKLVTATVDVSRPDLIKAASFIDFADDLGVQALVSLLTARIAAEKSIILGGLFVMQSIGPEASRDGNASATVQDDLDAQKYLQIAADSYCHLVTLIRGAEGLKPPYTRLPGDRLVVGGQILPRQYLASASGKFHCALREDGTLAVFAGPDPDHRTGLSWTSAPSAGRLTSAYLVLQGDSNLCLYDIGGVGQSPGAGHGPLLWQSQTPVDVADVALVMQDDGNLCLYEHPGAPGSSLIWSTVQTWPSNPTPGKMSGFTVPALSLFDPHHPDLGLLIDSWQSLAPQLQPQYKKTLADGGFNPWAAGTNAMSMADFAAAYGWAPAVRQLLGLRKLARLAALNVVSQYNTRQWHQVKSPRGGGSSYVTGESGYSFTDDDDGSANYNHDDDYEDGTDNLTHTYPDDVQNHWNAHWGDVKTHLSDSTLWDSYASFTDDWSEKVIELGQFIPANAPTHELQITAWGPAPSDATSGWAKASTVSYALTYQTSSGRSLRSTFTTPEPVKGTSPVLTGWPTPPAGVLQIEIWRKFVARDAPSTTFEVPRKVGVVTPGVTSWTDSDQAMADIVRSTS